MAKMSLAEYAKQFEKPDCAVCALQERDDIDEGYKNGILRRTIIKWLRDLGYEDKTLYDENNKPIGISETALNKHFTKGHHFSK